MGTDELRSSVYAPAHQTDQEDGPRPRIALLTPYTGGNLGDAAIQDAVIASLRLRLPRADFSGISLNSDNFVERHGTSAFPLCEANGQFYRMSSGRMTDPPEQGDAGSRSEPHGKPFLMKRAVRRVPMLWRPLRAAYAFGKRIWREWRHCVRGYHFLRTHGLLVVSGGGQLDDEWGGAWGHPFALFKWAVLARIAGVPSTMASVGACRIGSRASRFFLSSALRMAQYRSYRDKHSKDVAASLLPRAAEDAIVPDLAFSLPCSELPPPAGIRPVSQGRTIVAVSPIAYARPGIWPNEDPALYDRYVEQMTRVLSQLLERDYFTVVVYSSLGDDESVVAGLLGRLGEEGKKKFGEQIYAPTIRSWQDLVAILRDADFLIASRLHSVILGFLTQKPTIAISFDPKVDWVMEDLGQTDYLLRIRDFTADDVIKALGRVELRRKIVVDQIADYQRRSLLALTRQFDTLAGLAK